MPDSRSEATRPVLSTRGLRRRDQRMRSPRLLGALALIVAALAAVALLRGGRDDANAPERDEANEPASR